MKFNLNELKNDNIIITNDDEAFIGTVLADEPFSIEIKRLTQVEKIDTLQGATNDEGEFSNGEYTKSLFIASMAGVEGIVNEHNQPIGIEDGIREIIWEHGSDTLRNKIKTVISTFNINDDKKKEELEENLETTPAG